MKSILMSLIIVIGGPSGLPITSKLNVDPNFKSLTKLDSMFVINTLEMEKPTNHHIIKLDSVMIFTTLVETKRTYNSFRWFGRKGTFERVYFVRNGFIDQYYEIINGELINYGKEE
jgi:hypothetical protein